MSWTREIWRKEVAIHLFEMASIKFQKDIWLNKITKYQSDFTELINDFDGCGIPNYLDEFVRDSFLDKEQAGLLIELNALLENTGEYDTENDYMQLWDSKNWLNVSFLASKIFKDYFEKDLLNDFNSPYHKWKTDYPL